MTYNSNHKDFRRFITSFIEIRGSFNKKEYLYTILSINSLNYSSFGFSKRGLKAQCGTQPRASEATPWGFRIVESPRPVRAKALTLYVVILI